MPIGEPELTPLQIPRLANLATSARPAWLWSADATRLVWANAAGAAIFGAATVADAARLRFSAKDPTGAQVIRLAASLPSAGPERLERLRGFGAGFGRALMCVCSRIVLPGDGAAVLIAATEPAGPVLSLRERVRRLFSDGATPLAVFAPDGALVHATAAATRQLGNAATLSALGIGGVMAKAFEAGRGSGTARIGAASVEVIAHSLGQDDSRVLLLVLPPQPSEPPLQQAAAPARETSQPTHTQSTPAHPTPAHPTSAQDDPSSGERRHPLRFVWQMDADGRFVVGSDEFIELVGPRTIAACGRLWSEIAAELNLDPEDQVARAIATHETWSGIQIFWPVDESDERLPVELSGLPIFDRDRSFHGYRGFGVCRDVDRINHLARIRRSRPIGFAPPPVAAAVEAEAATPQPAATPPPASALPSPPPSAEPAAPAAQPTAAAEPAESPPPQPPAEAAAPIIEPPAEQQPEPVAEGTGSANVVPFRSGQAAETKAPSLSAGERNAFRELAQELTARLRTSPEEHEPAAGEPAAATPAAEAPQASTEAPSAEPAVTEAPIEAAVAETPEPSVATPIAAPPPEVARGAQDERVLLDRMPAGILVHRNATLLYANRHLLELCGYDSLDALAAAGGLEALLAAPGAGALADDGAAHRLSLKTRRGASVPVEARQFTVTWDGAPALALSLLNAEAEERRRETQRALAAAENEIRELRSNLERTARREAQKAAAAKADFLAKVSHEIRTPLNSMIGFAEVIMAERFGAIGNERYREYLKDMHAAGTHLVSLLNDLLDLSKVETGQLDLTFANVDLNDLVQQCVAIMQPQANRARIIIRSALTPALHKVVADARTLRQIVLNLLTNAIKFTGPGGQVIVSTAIADSGEAVLRVRDTGVGMRETDIEAVLDPFAQTATSASWGSGNSGLGLPLTKALAEANRANFSIKSAPNAGTLVEITFPSNRMAAE
jgi:signal transduction histidine kinase